ncbi:sigma-70 family RNA polymerase sigma factor [Streptomyces sp. NPDC059875]|uniref:sigma-70 family RNA polymerase sigma factor n=1 Tax=unclassified Streptomyces TaxID=2593676 RepID=UPI0036691F1A
MTITETTPVNSLLTDAQKRAVAPLVYGATNQAIGAQIHLSPDGVASHLRTARSKLGRRGCSRPVLVHALLTAREVPPPACQRPCPDFTAMERRLLQALAEHDLNEDIGRAVGVPAWDVRTGVDDLVTKACADNATHLVGLAHAWGVLTVVPGVESSAATMEPAR